jgi:hypothetical protein
MQTRMDRYTSVPSARLTCVELDTFKDYYFGTMMPPNMAYLALEHLGDKLRGIDFE